MTSRPGSDDGEPGGGAPRGGSDPIDALLTASDQIISATEEAALDDAVAQAMRAFGVGSYCLSSIHDGAERYVKVISSRRLRGGEPVAYSWLQERADAEGWGHIARAANLNSGVYVPLRAEGEVFGLMTVASPDREVSDGEVALLGAFGNQLGDAVVRLRLNKERSQKVAELEVAYVAQTRLLEIVRQLSTPVIPVHDGVLVMPLVGMVDASRSAMIMESLLQAIQKERASVVILDITGVYAVDTEMAGHIVQSVRAASLLGAECVLVGVLPAVAQTLVALGVDLGELVTRRNLQSGISYALEVMGRQATR